MGTPCSVASVAIDGSVHIIYGHWDGYPSGVGKMLVQHYNTQEMVDRLLSLGNFSSLDASIDCPDGHSFDTPVDGYTTFYGRDRGETGQQADEFSTYKQAVDRCGQGHDYFFDGTQWHYNDKVLTLVLLEKG